MNRKNTKHACPKTHIPKRELFSLLALLQSISHTAELDMVLEVILGRVRLITKAKFAILKVVVNSRKRLYPVASAGFKNDICHTMFRIDDEVSRTALKQTQITVINDIPVYFKKHTSAVLKSKGIRSLLVVPLSGNKRKNGTLSLYLPTRCAFVKEDMEMMRMVAGFISMVIDNSTMLTRIRKDYLNTIKTLAKIIDANDPYTLGHCEKVKKYSMMICKNMKLPDKHASAIRTASLLHDIGKIGIDLSILKKTEKLTDEDWKKIKAHPEIGARIVKQVGFLNDIVPIIKYHHSRYNGGGYPDSSKKKNNIPIGARIIAVADAYDAMTSHRPYRNAMSKENAMAELKRCVGEQFDPEVVNTFLKSLIS